MNIAPVLTLRGTVRRVMTRDVPARDAEPEQRDAETGRLIREAREAREGYTSTDVLVLTDEGGFATVIFTPESVERLQGQVPGEGDDVELPVRTFVMWQGSPTRRYASVGYSVAADLPSYVKIESPKPSRPVEAVRSASGS